MRNDKLQQNMSDLSVKEMLNDLETTELKVDSLRNEDALGVPDMGASIGTFCCTIVIACGS